jgi:hypothetical protein
MFRQWANQARVTDDAVGDFIGDFRLDDEAPSNFKSLKQLRLYLGIRAPVLRRSNPRQVHGSVIGAGSTSSPRKWCHEYQAGR